MMRKTAGASLSKAGATAMGIETAPAAPAGSNEPPKAPLSNGTTAHWKSTYTLPVASNSSYTSNKSSIAYANASFILNSSSLVLIVIYSFYVLLKPHHSCAE